MRGGGNEPSREYVLFCEEVSRTAREISIDDKIEDHLYDEPFQTALSLFKASERGIAAGSLDCLDLFPVMIGLRASPSRRSVLWALSRRGHFVPDAGVSKIMMPGTSPSVRWIMSFVSGRFRVTADELISKSRDINVSNARMRSYWISKNAFDIPVSRISEAAERDHTSVMSAISRVDIMVRRSPSLVFSLFDLADLCDGSYLSERRERCIPAVSCRGDDVITPS